MYFNVCEEKYFLFEGNNSGLKAAANRLKFRKITPSRIVKTNIFKVKNLQKKRKRDTFLRRRLLFEVKLSVKARQKLRPTLSLIKFYSKATFHLEIFIEGTNLTRATKPQLNQINRWVVSNYLVSEIYKQFFRRDQRSYLMCENNREKLSARKYFFNNRITLSFSR